MKEKITNYLLYFFGAALMAAGCIGLWGRHPLIAVGVLLTGVSLQPALYKTIALKGKAWRFILPTLGCIWIGMSVLMLTQKKPPVAEFIGRNDPPALVYNNKNGTTK